MTIKRFEFNPFPVNTYILYDDTNECVIIDAGMINEKEREELSSFIELNHLQIKHLLNTHLHFDHLLGNPFIRKKFGIKTTTHTGDLFLLDRVNEHAGLFGMLMQDGEVLVDKLLNDGDTITFGNVTLQAIHVPGHSPGSLVYYSEAEQCLFSGDVLFRRNIGRTDLPGGNYNDLISGIQKKLMTLPEHVTVYPGHGSRTTIGFEKKHNMYLC